MGSTIPPSINPKWTQILECSVRDHHSKLRVRPHSPCSPYGPFQLHMAGAVYTSFRHILLILRRNLDQKKGKSTVSEVLDHKV